MFALAFNLKASNSKASCFNADLSPVVELTPKKGAHRPHHFLSVPLFNFDQIQVQIDSDDDQVNQNLGTEQLVLDGAIGLVREVFPDKAYDEVLAMAHKAKYGMFFIHNWIAFSTTGFSADANVELASYLKQDGPLTLLELAMVVSSVFSNGAMSEETLASYTSLEDAVAAIKAVSTDFPEEVDELVSKIDEIRNKDAAKNSSKVQLDQFHQEVGSPVFITGDGEAQTIVSQETFGEDNRLTETINAKGETCLHAEMVIAPAVVEVIKPAEPAAVASPTKETKASPTIKGEANKPLVASKTVMSEALERANERNKRNKPRSR